MFSRLCRSNQIILCAISGGSLEKLTHAVTYWHAICFLRFRGFFRGVPGFVWGVPGFLGVFRVLGGCSWFFGCSEMFRDVPVFRCSGVPVFLKVLHAVNYGRVEHQKGAEVSRFAVSSLEGFFFRSQQLTNKIVY